MTRTSTVLGELDIGETPKLELARDTPLLASGLLALWAWWRARSRLLEPVPLIGLALACLATRLVFEVSILDYYFLAVGATLLLLDFVLARPPLWAVGWIVVTRYGLTWFETRASPGWIAVAFLALSIVPLVVGLVEVYAVRAPAGPAPPPPRGGTVRNLTPI